MGYAALADRYLRYIDKRGYIGCKETLSLMLS